MARARPLLFKTVSELQSKIDAYFESCFDNQEIKDKKGNTTGYIKTQIRPYTVSGLAVALDTSRQTLINYEEKADYFDTVKKAKDIIENWTEEQLYRSTQVTGVIFNLKNNYDWKDKTETDITSLGERINTTVEHSAIAKKYEEELNNLEDATTTSKP